MKKLIVLLNIILSMVSIGAAERPIEFFRYIDSYPPSMDIIQISDSLWITCYTDDYSTNKEGDFFALFIPKDTVISKIRERSQLSCCPEMLNYHNYTKDELQKHFEIYIFFAEQKKLRYGGTEEGYDGNMYPYYDLKDNVPISLYRYEDNQFIFLEDINRTTEVLHILGRRFLKEKIKIMFPSH